MKLAPNQTLKACALAAALAAVTAPAANAALILEISDGITTKTVTDGDANDNSAVEGVVIFNDSVGSFLVNVATGSSKPVIGSAYEPRLDLNSVNISGAAGTLSIRLTDTDFIGPVGASTPTSSAIGGVTDGTLTFDTYLDNSNAEFGTATALASMEFANGAFSGTDHNYASTSDLFSLTIATTIEHLGHFQITSFNSAVAVPEPGTLGMVGASLLVLQIARRRRSLRKV